MTTYQVQLRDFRSVRVTRVVASGVDFDEAVAAGRLALAQSKGSGDLFTAPYTSPASHEIYVLRIGGHKRDEYVRLVPEPAATCNRCGAETPLPDPESTYENLCERCNRSYADRCWDHLDEPDET